MVGNDPFQRWKISPSHDRFDSNRTRQPSSDSKGGEDGWTRGALERRVQNPSSEGAGRGYDARRGTSLVRSKGYGFDRRRSDVPLRQWVLASTWPWGSAIGSSMQGRSRGKSTRAFRSSRCESMPRTSEILFRSPSNRLLHEKVSIETCSWVPWISLLFETERKTS